MAADRSFRTLADVITVVEGNAHEEIKKLSGKIDMVFLDADKEGYIGHLGKTMPLFRRDGLVGAHNIIRASPNRPFMKAITTNPKLETVIRGGMSIHSRRNGGSRNNPLRLSPSHVNSLRSASVARRTR